MDIPAELTSFVGRRDELAAAQEMVRRSRLVTLSGLGGVGKTRLALRVAASMRAEFPDGVCLVELSHVQDGQLLPHAVAVALELQDQTMFALVDVIADYLSDKRLLLILDTCEGLVEQCAELVAALLAAAPGLSVLTTSRQSLGLVGEQLLVVPPLELPPPGESTDDVSSYDAVALFTQRGQGVARRFSLTTDNQTTIASICRRLDGIPLAIELAAAWLRMLGPEQILDRLDDRFRLLTRGSRAAAERHQTLRSAIGWSHELCTPAERLLWARLSVFSTDFDLASVEDICGDADLAAGEIFETIASLVDKSIVFTVPHEGALRYALLDTVRDYGREWLDRLGAMEELRRRHRDHYVRLAEEAEADWCSPRQLSWVARLRRELPHMRDAMEFSLADAAEHETGLHLAATLWPYWQGCGSVSEGQHWLDRALAGHRQPSIAAMRALWVRGTIAYLQGDLAGARTTQERSQTYARSLGDELGEARAVQRLGVVDLLSGDPAQAQRRLTAAIESYSRLGVEDNVRLMAEVELGVSHTFAGDLDQAESHCDRTRAVAAGKGDRFAQAYSLYVLALIAAGRGDAERGISQAGASLRLQYELRNLLGMAMDVELLATLAVADGSPECSAVLQGAATPLWRATGKRLFSSTPLNSQAEKTAAAARRLLGDDAYDAAYARGGGFTLDETIEYALTL